MNTIRRSISVCSLARGKSNISLFRSKPKTLIPSLNWDYDQPASYKILDQDSVDGRLNQWNTLDKAMDFSNTMQKKKRLGKSENAPNLFSYIGKTLRTVKNYVRHETESDLQTSNTTTYISFDESKLYEGL